MNLVGECNDDHRHQDVKHRDAAEDHKRAEEDVAIQGLRGQDTQEKGKEA